MDKQYDDLDILSSDLSRLQDVADKQADLIASLYSMAGSKRKTIRAVNKVREIMVSDMAQEIKRCSKVSYEGRTIDAMEAKEYNKARKDEVNQNKSSFISKAVGFFRKKSPVATILCDDKQQLERGAVHSSSKLLETPQQDVEDVSNENEEETKKTQ